MERYQSDADEASLLVERSSSHPRSKRAKADHRTFTATNVLTLRPKKADKSRQHMIWDWGTEAARGLGILVNPSGTKSYRATYYFPGFPFFGDNTPAQRRI